MLRNYINHKFIYLTGLHLLALALPTSMFLMSVAQFILFFNWLLDKKLPEKFKQILNNTPLLVFLSIFAIHLTGMIWTTDVSYGLKDLRIKLPLLLLPLIVSTSPKLSRKEFYVLLTIYVLANLFSTLVGFVKFITRDYEDIRDLSVFISHIRLSMNLVLSIFICLFFAMEKYSSVSPAFKILMLVLAFWFFIFLIIMESLTGVGLFLIILTAIVFYLIGISQNQVVKVSLVLLSLFVFLGTLWYLYWQYQKLLPDRPFFEGSNVEFTKNGNPYIHDSTIYGIENGEWIGKYICWEELKEWNLRSSVNLDSIIHDGNSIKLLLVRYLTSKNLRKDAESISKLTDEDIRAIENGIPSVNYLNDSKFELRLKNTLQEIIYYRLTGNPLNGSVSKRLEFWRAGWNIIRENFWFGVGTGDIDQAFKDTYRKIKSPLPPDQWWRTHNQYLTVWATLGIVGLIIFLVALFIPPMKLKMWNDFFFLVFYLISLISMISGDTLDTQAGVTFFAFFTSLFLFGRSQKEEIIDILRKVPS